MNIVRLARSIAKRTLPPSLVRSVRTWRSAGHFDEVELVAEVFAPHAHSKQMLDVGACYGRAFEPFVRQGWRVLAFEPDAKNREALAAEHQSLLGDLVWLDSRAVGDRSMRGVALYRSDVSEGISSLLPFHKSHVSGGQVDIVTLADAMAERQIDAVGFLKIDTEGNDLPVLKGYPWSSSAPECIVAEFEDAKSKLLGYSWREIGDLLLSKGYTVFASEWWPIERYGTRHRWRTIKPFPCELDDPKGWGNFVAFTDASLAANYFSAARSSGGSNVMAPS